MPVASDRPAFDELARSLVQRHPHHPLPQPAVGTVVVVPSLTFPVAELRKIVGVRHYEERMLFTVLLLADPRLDLVYVTSAPVDPHVVEYYLQLLPDPESARGRLHLRDAGAPDPTPLSRKLLAHAPLLADLSGLAADPDGALMLTFNVTDDERRLAERIGVPLYGPRPDLADLGSKTGARRVARAAGVEVLPGAENLWSLGDVTRSLARLRADHPHVEAAVVKLNHGFSGQGNAVVTLDGGMRSLPGAWHTAFAADEESWPSFAEKIVADGAIVEEFLGDPAMVSPSAQVSIAPGGDVTVLSTHDQVLGGPHKQVYLGCRFPAHPDYRADVQDAARAIAEVLAGHGVIGSFGIDFFVVPRFGGHRLVLCEINLRIGGTTHPYWTTRLLTGATYDPARGELRTDDRPFAYVATDNLCAPALVGRTPADITACLAARGLAWDPVRQRGVVAHMLGALREHGKMGVTCIAATGDEAEAMHQDVRALLTG